MEAHSISQDPANWLKGYRLSSIGIPDQPSIFFENEVGRTARLTFNPSCFPFGAAEVSPIIGQIVTTVTKEPDGHLTIVFESGEALWITAHARYEPWEICGDLGQLMVCLGGGELAVWGRSKRLR